MQPNFISILNTPSGTRSVNIDNTNGVVTGYGLSPFKQNLIRSCTVQRSVVETLQVWTVTMTSGVANTLSFSISQLVNGLPSIRTFTMAQTASTTAAEVLTAIDGFFGVTGDTSSYTNASWGAVKFKRSNSSTTITVTISQVSGQAYPTVSEVSNSTIANGLTATTGCTTAGTHAVGSVITITKSGHGLVSGNVVYLSSFDGDASIVNGSTYIVKYASSSTFSLYTMEGVPVVYQATGTNATAGSFLPVATATFGTAAYVNSDSAANNSTQVATVTANNYSLVTFIAGYDNTTTAEASTRIAPIHYWISEDSNGITAIDWIAANLLS